MMECWFNLPNDTTATELDVTIPVKGRVKVSADIAREMDEWRDLLLEYMRKQKLTVHGRLRDMLASCLSGYEGIASEALHGAQSVRDDMLVMLRAVVIVAESIVGDHLNHGQKNERIRGMIGVLERSIDSLRQEQFRFHGNVWRRDRDLFAWNEPERRLRDRISELERQLSDATRPITSMEPSEDGMPDDLQASMRPPMPPAF
jgi:hypothetical protein